MRIYEVVLCSGAKLNIEAKVMLDDPALSGDISFYHDDAQSHLVAMIRRSEVAGIIFHPRKAGVMTATTPYSNQGR